MNPDTLRDWRRNLSGRMLDDCAVSWERDIEARDDALAEAYQWNDALRKRLEAIVSICDDDIWPINTGHIRKRILALAAEEETC